MQNNHGKILVIVFMRGNKSLLGFLFFNYVFINLNLHEYRQCTNPLKKHFFSLFIFFVK